MESVTFSEARVEYQKQMSSKLVTPLLEFFQKIYLSLRSESVEKILSRFQHKCSEIPKWNQDVVADETGKLIEASRCDYLEELMTALFIAHTKVMASVRLQNKKNKKLTITVPKLDHFLHRVFTEVAKSFWKAPFLFDTGLPAIERQKNLLQAENMIEEAIFAAVRDMLPLKKILQEYISEPEGEDEDVLTKSDYVKEVTPVKEIEEPLPTPVKEIEEPLPAPVIKAEEKTPGDRHISVNQKEEKVDVQKAEQESRIKIETEPSVQFLDKVSVFEETKAPEIRDIQNPLERPAATSTESETQDEYDIPDEREILNIGQEVGGLDAGEVEDIDNPGLGQIDDFEELT